MNRTNDHQIDVRRLLTHVPVVVLALWAAATVGCSKKAPVVDPGVGDLEIIDVAFTPGAEDSINVEVELFDNLTNPTTIAILLRANGHEEVMMLTCNDVAGQVNTCTGGTGTCSGSCPDREYDEIPDKVFSGSCQKPRLGLQVCTCSGYRVKATLESRLSLSPGDKVQVVLDPQHQYTEASEDNNTRSVVIPDALKRH